MPQGADSIGQGVPHSGLDGNYKRPVYATAVGQTKRGLARSGGQVTAIRLDEPGANSVVKEKAPAFLHRRGFPKGVETNLAALARCWIALGRHDGGNGDS